MKNDIDELEAIKTDIVTTINLINKDWKFKFQYDKETNTIHQCVNGRVYKINLDNTKAYYEALFACTNNYGDYIKGCVNAIKKRTERMGKQIL